MANELTEKLAQNMATDIISFDELVNGDESTIVTTRTGNTYPSAERAINIMFQNGGLPATPFKTKADMEASSLNNNDYAIVTNDTDSSLNGLYVKDNAVWLLSEFGTKKQIEKFAESSVFAEMVRLPSTLLNNHFVNISGGVVTYQVTTNGYGTYLFEVSPNTDYLITSEGATRMRVSLIDAPPPATGNYNQTIEFYDFDLSEPKNWLFNSGSAKYAVIYVHTDPSVTVGLLELPVKLKWPILADGLSRPITSSDIASDAVTANKVDFVQQDVVSLKSEATGYIVYVDTDGTVDLRALSSNTGNLRFKIKPNAGIRVSMSGTNHNRFRLVVSNSENITRADRVITIDDSLSSYEFYNDSEGVYLYAYFKTSAFNPSRDSVPIVEMHTNKLLGFSEISGADNSARNSPHTYRLHVGKVALPESLAINKTPEYPRLCAVKYHQLPKRMPEPVGYLFTSLDLSDTGFYYAKGEPEKMEFLAKWDKSITPSGNKDAHQYRQHITEDGDIICVWRGDLYSGSSRNNPIIYPADDYDNPVVIDLGDRTKPTSWFMSTGISNVPKKDCFVFTEYTRPHHLQTHIWKVTKPYTNPDNWQIKHSLDTTQGYKAGDPDNLKHRHTIVYDPWSGMLINSVGDNGIGTKLYSSKDDGDTWLLEAENNEAYLRVTRVSVAEDGLYWGSDSHYERHIFIKAPRGDDGYPLLNTGSMEVLALFPSDTASTATYETVRLTRPNGFLFLDRQDSYGKTAPLRVRFWSLDHNAMYDVGGIGSALDTANNGKGFRNEAICAYQPLNYDKIVVGYNQVVQDNYNDVAGNSAEHRVMNLTLQLETVFADTAIVK